MHSNEGRMTVTLTDIQREQGAIRRWQADVAEATLPFERRWTLAALKRVDPDIHRRLIAQRSLLDQALVTGTPEEIELHGAALCRGYAKAIQVLEVAAEPDDAYMLGQNMQSGFRVAIGRQKAVAQRAREVHGETVVWITPDEVATIVANLEVFKPIVAIKRLFPGEEMLDVHPGEQPEKGRYRMKFGVCKWLRIAATYPAARSNAV
jgi:hypothetical protein